MNSKVRTAALSAVLAAFTLSAAAAETFSLSLEQSDSLKASGSFAGALSSLETALGQAGSDTETALALSKMAEIESENLKNCDKALEYAERAARLPAEPVGRVVAMRVMGACYLKQNRNQPAIDILEQAAGLTGVDWAMPSVSLTLGDAYRAVGRFNDAIDTYRKVLAMNTDNAVKAVAQLNIGLTCQYSLQDPAGARTAYAQARRLNPGLGGEIDMHTAKLGQ